MPPFKPNITSSKSIPINEPKKASKAPAIKSTKPYTRSLAEAIEDPEPSTNSSDYDNLPIQINLRPYTPPPNKTPNTQTLPALFQDAPLPSIPGTNHDTPTDIQNQADADLTNMTVAGVMTMWSQPNMTPAMLLKLIKETRELVKHRRNLYNLDYGSNDNSSGSKRPRTIFID
jgi:hypothetical protein